MSPKRSTEAATTRRRRRSRRAVAVQSELKSKQQPKKHQTSAHAIVKLLDLYMSSKRNLSTQLPQIKHKNELIKLFKILRQPFLS